MYTANLPQSLRYYHWYSYTVSNNTFFRTVKSVLVIGRCIIICITGGCVAGIETGHFSVNLPLSAEQSLISELTFHFDAHNCHVMLRLSGWRRRGSWSRANRREWWLRRACQIQTWRDQSSVSPPLLHSSTRKTEKVKSPVKLREAWVENRVRHTPQLQS